MFHGLSCTFKSVLAVHLPVEILAAIVALFRSILPQLPDFLSGILILC